VVFPTAHAIGELVGPQFQDALAAGKQLLAACEHLCSSFAFLTTNHTVHERLIYPNPVCMSNAVRLNWQEIKSGKP
jgi:hypothetical protein